MCISVQNCKDFFIFFQKRRSSWWPELYVLVLLRLCLCVSFSVQLTSSSINESSSVSVFQGERIEKGQGTWDPSEEPHCDVTSLSWLLFSFLFVPETFYKRTEQKEKNIGSSTAVITTTRAVLLIQLLLRCMTAFFFYMFILSTDLVTSTALWTQRTGATGAEHWLHGIFCTFSWTAFYFYFFS